MSTDDTNDPTNEPNVELSLDERLDEFFRTFYADEIAQLAQRYPSEQRAIEVDWSDLNRYDPDIADDYRNNPGGVAQHVANALRCYDLPFDVDLSDADVRLVNLPPGNTHYVGEYSPSEIHGTLRAIIGQVTKVTQTDPIMRTAAFECLRCGTISRVPQSGEDYQEPHNCSGCDRDGPYSINYQQSSYQDWQKVRLQVPPERSTGSDATFDVVLRDDLTGSVEPGDRVIANVEVHFTQKESKKAIFRAYGEAQSIQQQNSTFDDIDTDEYTEEIAEIASLDDPLAAVVDSIAPNHYGDRLVKEAIALQLFGGVNATKPDGSAKRGSSHIFLVGDPGCGKSTLLKFACALEPRSVFTMGKNSSAAGLTAAAVRDEFGEGQWSLEAGALVEAHNGLCAVDELDKMDPSDQGGLYEAMSDQTVSVSKAGINATLPARTKVLAAANPEMGRFDAYSQIAEQINLDPVLLSRFDLVFLMADTPDAEHDRSVAEQLNESALAAQNMARGNDEAAAHVAPEIDVEVLQAYIAHSRTIIPRFTDEALERIANEYVELRGANNEGGPVPTTARDITAMHRLCEAAARARLSESIEERDVSVALRLRRKCLADIGIDPETGEFDADIVETGQSTTQRDRVRSVLDIIRALMEEHEDKPGAPEDAIFEAATDAGMEHSRVEHELERMSESGKVYRPGQGFYRTV